MGHIRKAFKNFETTAIGALAGGTFYGSEAGLTFPNSSEDWVSFAISLLLFLLGAFAKDARTGSATQ